MLGDFPPTSEEIMARRYGHRPVPVPTNFGDEVMDYDAPYDAPRRAPKPQRSARPPSQKKRLAALKKTVRVSLKLGRCGHALAEWKALSVSTLPGAKKAARRLKTTFANKCMRIPRKK